MKLLLGILAATAAAQLSDDGGKAGALVEQARLVKPAQEAPQRPEPGFWRGELKKLHERLEAERIEDREAAVTDMLRLAAAAAQAGEGLAFRWAVVHISTSDPDPEVRGRAAGALQKLPAELILELTLPKRALVGQVLPLAARVVSSSPPDRIVFLGPPAQLGFGHPAEAPMYVILRGAGQDLRVKIPVYLTDEAFALQSPDGRVLAPGKPLVVNTPVSAPGLMLRPLINAMKGRADNDWAPEKPGRYAVELRYRVPGGELKWARGAWTPVQAGVAVPEGLPKVAFSAPAAVIVAPAPKASK